jgi:histidyl-tRNA synthetase
VRALFNHGLPEMEAALDNLIGIVDCLETLGYRYQIDISSGRGFEYYTGLIFQLFVGEVKVGGGGRYDALIPLLGGDAAPAAGFALYFDHLVDLTAPASLPVAAAPRVVVRAVPAVLGQAFGVASRLQEAGYRAEICHGAEIADDVRWLVEINEQAPVFVVRDRVTQAGAECDTIEQLLPLLGEVDGNQDRTA